MAEFPKEINVEVKWMAALIRPGDTLVLGFDHPVDNATYNMIITYIHEQMPDVKVAIVDNISNMAVYRPEPGDEPNRCKTCGRVPNNISFPCTDCEDFGLL